MWLCLMLASAASAASVEDILATELDRAMTALADAPDKPYYVALQVEDAVETTIAARDGALDQSDVTHDRTLDVDLRVGAPDLDSTHQLRGFSALDSDSRRTVRVPIDGDEASTRHAVWREVDRAWREAAERIVIVRANQAVKVEEESPAPDFALPTTPEVAREAVPEPVFDQAAWETTITGLSASLDASPTVHQSSASLSVVRTVKTFVDTAGSRIEHGSTHARLALMAQTTAADGDVVHVFEAWDVHDPASLPSPAEADELARAIVRKLEALAVAPRGQPYSGPVILLGRASGVFFHEVFGHRVEGHRQKREDEGKTFVEYVGRPILPAFIDVVDDPTVARVDGVDLNGHYRFDDEGTAAIPTSLVDDGVFKGFLMGRSPIPGFEATNGHGRRSPGAPPVARMGNTIVKASETVPLDTLRERLREEARAQGLEYGILVDEIDGGFTLTGREMPNAFNVRASASWRVYVDGRPDELVRGIDLVGTPLVAFSNLIGASDAVEVFNGYCGAESGWVPVSAVAPALLFRQLEFQLKEKGQERPPLLAKPTVGPDGDADAEDAR